MIKTNQIQSAKIIERLLYVIYILNILMCTRIYALYLCLRFLTILILGIGILKSIYYFGSVYDAY